MPLARYFFLVGGVLLALLFVVDAVAPKLPVPERADTDLPVIRIHSDRKWPERVVFDTSVPTVTPAPQALASAAPATPAAPVAAAPDEAKARVRESFAQLPLPSDSRHVHVAELRKPEAKPRRKRKLVRRRLGPPPVMLAQQPQFGFFGNSWW